MQHTRGKVIGQDVRPMLRCLCFAFSRGKSETLTERDGGREEREGESEWSSFAEFSQLFSLGRLLSHREDKVSMLLSQSPEKMNYLHRSVKPIGTVTVGSS